MSSVLIAVSTLILGGTLARIAPKYHAIFADLYDGTVVLPLATRLVLSLEPTGWILLSICMAVFILSKDYHPFGRRFPNWPFVALLAAVLVGTTTALFNPLLVTIAQIQTHEKSGQTPASEHSPPTVAAAPSPDLPELPTPPPAP